MQEPTLLFKNYVIDRVIGKGGFGTVYKARHKDTNELVALKHMQMNEEENEGFPITAVREIKLLKALKHENVITLKEVVTALNVPRRFMVLEFMDHDFVGLTHRYGKTFTLPQMKAYLKQLFDALFYLHASQVVHRDIKGGNILVNNKGQIKLTDFNLARQVNLVENGRLTLNVVTLWYRAPELLFHDSQYSAAVDMWAAGCVMAELMTGRPLFPAANEVELVDRICKLCGNPTEANWPGVSKLPNYKMFRMPKTKSKLREYFNKFSLPEKAIDLLEQLLTLDPKVRLTAGNALDHDFFWEDPLPLELSKLPTYSTGCHELAAKEDDAKRRQQKKMQMQMQQRKNQHYKGPPNRNQNHNNNYRHNHHPNRQHHRQNNQNLNGNQRAKNVIYNTAVGNKRKREDHNGQNNVKRTASNNNSFVMTHFTSKDVLFNTRTEVSQGVHAMS